MQHTHAPSLRLARLYFAYLRSHRVVKELASRNANRGALLALRLTLGYSKGHPLLGPSPSRTLGGASRVRTDDPLLAKQVLSQLSYGPSQFCGQNLRWWVWVDSNHRPHPYQGCALTT